MEVWTLVQHTVRTVTLPGGGLDTLDEGVGHMRPGDDNDPFGAVLFDFLDRLTRRFAHRPCSPEVTVQPAGGLHRDPRVARCAAAHR